MGKLHFVYNSFEALRTSCNVCYSSWSCCTMFTVPFEHFLLMCPNSTWNFNTFCTQVLSLFWSLYLILCLVIINYCLDIHWDRMVTEWPIKTNTVKLFFYTLKYAEKHTFYAFFLLLWCFWGGPPYLFCSTAKRFSWRHPSWFSDLLYWNTQLGGDVIPSSDFRGKGNAAIVYSIVQFMP